ncbi:hypothetical protein PTKIN_Ptkin16aG0506500 [Pterospermum kingtungense]
MSFDLQKVPLWVHLVNVPLEAFNRTTSIYIASALGKPLYMDRITAKQQRLAYVKICVEVDALQEIPKVIHVEMREGRTVQVQVDILWYPQRCRHCKFFGHNTKNYVKKLVVAKEVWVPKQDFKPKLVEVSSKLVEVSPKPIEISSNLPSLRMEPVANVKDPKGKAPIVVSFANRFAALSDQAPVIEDVVLERKQRKTALNVSKVVTNLKP